MREFFVRGKIVGIDGKSHHRSITLVAGIAGDDPGKTLTNLGIRAREVWPSFTVTYFKERA